jgi:hypothetical protein
MAGDGCESPLPLGANGAVVIDFSGLSRQSPNECGAPSRDAVLAFDAPGAGRLVLELTPGATDQTLAVDVKASCAEPSPARCARAGAGETVVLVEDHDRAGPLFAWVSSSTSAPVTVLMRWVPSGDGATCEQPLALALAYGRGAAFLPGGPLVGPMKCGPGASGGLALSLQLTESNRLALSAEGDSDGGSALEVASGSCTGSPQGCAFDPGPRVALDLGAVVAGPLAARVAAVGPSVLHWNLSNPQPGEACGDRIELGVVDAPTPAVVSGSLAGSFDDHATGCAPRGTADRVYGFETLQEQTMRLTLTSDAGVVLAVSEAPCGAAWAHCASAVPLLLPHLARGKHYVALEGAGDFGLRIETLPLLQGDSCPFPFEVSPPRDGGVLTVSGDLTGALDDITLECSTPQPDQVFRVALDNTYSSSSNLRLSAQRTDGGALAVGIRAGVCDSWIDRCFAGQTGWSRNVESLRYGVATLWVEGAEGPYSLDVQRFDAHPGMDCSQLLNVSVGPDAGRLTFNWGTDDAPLGDTISACGTNGADDGFFSVTNDDAGVLTNVTVRVQSDGGDVGSIFQGASCYSADFPSSCTPGAASVRLDAGATARFSAEGLPTRGLTTLIVDSTPVPAGDFCAIALPLVADAGAGTAWTVATTADLTSAIADTACYCPAGGADQYFNLTYPASTTQVRVTVRPLAPFTPRLSFTYQCTPSLPTYCPSGSGNQVCPSATDAGLSVTNVFAPIPGGRATLVVSSGGGTPGPYELTVTNQ